jgi:hypothetical protein
MRLWISVAAAGVMGCVLGLPSLASAQTAPAEQRSGWTCQIDLNQTGIPRQVLDEVPGGILLTNDTQKNCTGSVRRRITIQCRTVVPEWDGSRFNRDVPCDVFVAQCGVPGDEFQRANRGSRLNIDRDGNARLQCVFEQP